MPKETPVIEPLHFSSTMKELKYSSIIFMFNVLYQLYTQIKTIIYIYMSAEKTPTIKEHCSVNLETPKHPEATILCVAFLLVLDG